MTESARSRLLSALTHSGPGYDPPTAADARLAAVLAECDRIEVAVRANPQDPDFDSAYLAAIRRIRAVVEGETS